MIDKILDKIAARIDKYIPLIIVMLSLFIASIV